MQSEFQTVKPLRVQLSKKDEHAAKTKAEDTMALVRKFEFEPRSETMGRVTRDSGTLQGFRTEYAVARLFDLDVPEVNIQSDGGIDMWIGDLSVDVKCTGIKSPLLIFDSFDRFAADIAILTKFYDSPEIDVCGWITKPLFKDRHYIHDFGFGERMVVSAENLLPIENLWRLIAQKKFAA